MNQNTQPIADIMNSSVSRLTALLSPLERLKHFQRENVAFEGNRYMMGAYIGTRLIFVLHEDIEGLIHIDLMPDFENRVITKSELSKFANFEKAWGVH